MAGIDRDYWLDFAKENVSKSIQSREDAAIKLDEFLSWIWTIYTSIFALSSLLGYMTNSLWQLIFVCQPILIIMLARFECKMVSMPSISEGANADPNVVPEIIEGFITIVKDKKKKLRRAVFATVIAMLSICIALIGYNTFDADKELKNAVQEMKLKKELNDQTVSPVNGNQKINDDIKIENEKYELQIQNEIRKRKLECIRNNNQKCVDSLKLLEK